MRIALIDDDSTQISALSEIVSTELSNIGYPYCKTDVFHSGEAFLSQWRAGMYDIIILDIFMDKLSGIETARRVREADDTVRLVFCSTSNEFASESYEVNAQYYLHKPVTQQKIAVMLQRLNPEILEQSKIVALPDGYRIIPRHLLYTDYYNHVVTLYIKKETPYRLRISQSKLESFLLPYGYFFSPIKGIILNFHEVVKMDGETFIMSDGKSIHITRRKYKEAKEAYTQFHFEKMRREMKYFPADQ